jgi:hypothetical protein
VGSNFLSLRLKIGAPERMRAVFTHNTALRGTELVCKLRRLRSAQMCRPYDDQLNEMLMLEPPLGAYPTLGGTQSHSDIIREMSCLLTREWGSTLKTQACRGHLISPRPPYQARICLCGHLACKTTASFTAAVNMSR